MVRKAFGKWRIYADYIDLNRACQKDSFPLSKIDQLVNATSGHKFLSFMDAFSGYNQICMNLNKMLPFGLKNVGAMYQQLVSKVFKDQINHNMQVYIDDMLVIARSRTMLSTLRRPLITSTSTK